MPPRRRLFARRRAPGPVDVTAAAAGRRRIRKIVLPPKVPEEARKTLELFGLGRPDLVTPELLSSIARKIEKEGRRGDSFAEAAKDSFGTSGFREEAETSRTRANALLDLLKSLKQLPSREWEEE